MYIMLSDNELAILSCFFPDVHDRTAKELETDADLSHEPAFRTLKRLAAEGFLKEKKYGKTNVYEHIWREESFLVFCYANMKRLLELKAKRPILLEQARDIGRHAHARVTLLLPSMDEKKEASIICIGATHDLETVEALLKAKYVQQPQPHQQQLPKIIGKTKEEFEHLRHDDIELYHRIMGDSIIIDGIEPFFKEAYDRHG